MECIPQATPSRIQQQWDYEVKFDISARSFDFAVFNKKTRKLFLIETNFYNRGIVGFESIGHRLAHMIVSSNSVL